MAEETAAVVTTETTTPVIDRAPQFTFKPIELKPTAETPKVDPKPAEVKPPASAELVAALAKTNKEARDLRAANEAYKTQVADLVAKHEAATEGSKRAAQLEAEIAELIAHPRKYLERYKPKGDTGALQEILNGFAEDPEPENPRLTALEAAEKARADAEAKRQADADVQTEKDRIEAARKSNEAVNARLSKMVEDENAKAGEGTVGRWSLVAEDPGTIDSARLAALQYMVENKLDLTLEQANELVAQALDQLESAAREEAMKKAKRLGLQVNSQPSRNSFSMANKPIVESGRQSKPLDVSGKVPAVNDRPARKPHGFTTG